jgi:glutathione S-transferase
LISVTLLPRPFCAAIIVPHWRGSALWPTIAPGNPPGALDRWTMALVELITVLALLQFVYFGILVGKARDRHGVKAPAVTGNDIFERYMRVQMNTLELLILFLPALWIATAYVAAYWVALLGLVYLIGRFVYLRAYVAEPSRRSLGFSISSLPILALLAIDLIGCVSRLIRGY